MTFPYVPAFLVLLVVYMAYSAWARLDPRYPIAGALLLLVVTAIVDAAGSIDVANTLAEFVFFLLAAGVVLLLIDHVRGEPRTGGPPRWGSGLRSWHPDSPDPSQPRQGSAEQTFQRSQ